MGLYRHVYFENLKKRLITLNNASHHPTDIKINKIRNSYSEADFISTTDQLDHSMKMVDQLYINNGYTDPRQYIQPKNTGTRANMKKRKRKQQQKHLLKLPFINDQFSAKVSRFIKTNKLPLKLVNTRPKTLGNMFCRSRPRDKRECSRQNCNICDRLVSDTGKNCKIKGAVYEITCNLCQNKYVGETGRKVFDRLTEHYNYTKNPTAKSYKEQTLAKHYLTEHPGQKSDLKFEILDTEQNTLRRKIKEAYYINNLNPEINEKQEMDNLNKYILTTPYYNWVFCHK